MGNWDSILDEIGKSSVEMRDEEAERIARYIVRNNEGITKEEFREKAGFRSQILNQRSVSGLADIKWEEGDEESTIKTMAKEDRNAEYREAQRRRYPDLDRPLRPKDMKEAGFGNMGLRNKLPDAGVPFTAENVAGRSWTRNIYPVEKDVVEDILSGTGRDEIIEEYGLGKLDSFGIFDPVETVDWIAASYLRWVPEDERPSRYQTEDISQKILELEKEFEVSEYGEVNDDVWDELTETSTDDLPPYMQP